MFRRRKSKKLGLTTQTFLVVNYGRYANSALIESAVREFISKMAPGNTYNS